MTFAQTCSNSSNLLVLEEFFWPLTLHWDLEAINSKENILLVEKEEGFFFFSLKKKKKEFLSFSPVCWLRKTGECTDMG